MVGCSMILDCGRLSGYLASSALRETSRRRPVPGEPEHIELRPRPFSTGNAIARDCFGVGGGGRGLHKFATATPLLRSEERVPGS
jgi:hypothetical protein